MNSLDWHVGRLRAMGRHADADRLEDFTLTRAWPESVPRLPDDAEAPVAPQNATGRPPRTSGQKESQR